MYNNILEYKGGRYFWVSLVLLLVSFAVYFSQEAWRPPNGGTWQGYVLGTIGALLIVWLAYLGVRKRRYASTLGTVQGWTSAHVYLGSSLLIIGTLHCAFQFGLNVHTLAYVLMCIVIFSGFYGLYAYMRYPDKLSRNRSNQSLDQRFSELDELDQQGKDIASRCNTDIQTLINSAIARTSLGGGLWSQLKGQDNSKVELSASEDNQSRTKVVDNRNQQAAIDYIAMRIPNVSKKQEAQDLQDILYIFGRRRELLNRIRREISLQARLKVWLLFHIPTTIVLIVALIIHIVTVFLYW
ncbi:hypothetical protein [uncultured Pseudoteredinibacter sp.]|uniref:hypothetical protein n=1 Tax=uncultured Pseudoteredinibacter sp. TaxID=1641701 RepID=UPI002630E29F|nr:hypothetical protein [uncultured Pseudoteredinibacter sp.]